MKAVQTITIKIKTQNSRNTNPRIAAVLRLSAYKIQPFLARRSI